MRIRYSVGSLPSPFHKSTVYKAGFFVSWIIKTIYASYCIFFQLKWKHKKICKIFRTWRFLTTFINYTRVMIGYDFVCQTCVLSTQDSERCTNQNSRIAKSINRKCLRSLTFHFPTRALMKYLRMDETPICRCIELLFLKA